MIRLATEGQMNVKEWGLSQVLKDLETKMRSNEITGVMVPTITLGSFQVNRIYIGPML